MTALELANQEQRKASNPNVSAFVAASAGTGKTKLLTDRLLRLMLTGTPPGKILCLTYTKAAAAEMAIRLNRKLGEWVVMPEAELNKALTALNMPASATSRQTARKLFAEVLDLPGGMKINTIHAFCQSLLRRFPLEAQLSPHFELEDEISAQHRLREAREDALADPVHMESIFLLAEETSELEFADLMSKFAAGYELQNLLLNFSPDNIIAMQRAALNAPDETYKAIMCRVINITNEGQIKSDAQRILEAGNVTGQKWASCVLSWLSQDPAARQKNWDQWIDAYFTNDGKKRDISRFFGPKLKNERPPIATRLEAEQDRIERAEEARLSVKLLDLNNHLLRLASPILRRDAVQKAEQTILTYSDLIAITLKLLQKPEDVAWILYKLDGGIDHLLLDEVQDTAPAQWQIADAIADEFFAGAGARDVKRSIFAVGDAKQSIFSFQGADLESFSYYREKFRQKVQRAGQDWLDGQLSVSFRSTEPVLRLVDAVFATGAACEGVCKPGSLTHEVSRTGQAGRVTLWPLTKSVSPADLPAWDVPDSYTSTQSGKALLAQQIAEHIHNSLQQNIWLPSRKRAIRAGDFLVLVRRRDELVTALTRACKAMGVPIAGLDRMVLTDQQAVSDLLALCDALLLPSDDVAFAQFLASPLGGLSDESLMKLAIGRAGTLAAALYAKRDEQADWATANAFFQNLRQKADFISPYELLAYALGPMGGKAKLLQRLGPEAAEPIDEMLAEAQAFAQKYPASLQSFLFMLRQSGASIKREAEASGDVVRIMTVHGAKGLQAPIVFLPDTTTIPKPRETLFQLPVPQQDITVPIFCPRKQLRSQAVVDAVERNKASDLAEYNRLLYVALTRAEDELIICGAEGRQTPPAACWYNLVKAGFSHLGALPDAEGGVTIATPQLNPADRQEAHIISETEALPRWAGSAPDWHAAPPPLETAKPEPLAPSRSAETDIERIMAASPVTAVRSVRASRDQALAKGRIIHSLLQHLPDLAADQRAAAARAYLAQPGLNLAAAEQATLAHKVLNILTLPALAPLFAAGSKAEVPLAGVVGDIEIGGLVDRLAITAHEILLADYKTDRQPPTSVDAIPPAYLRQIAAYQALLSQIFPDKPVTCLLIWTESAVAMPIPEDLLNRYAPAPRQPFVTA
ncbi:MAG: double-strand break repair helicase AddA [Acidocella sp. 20-57-95]|nr:MAG: double-strand break repair helicase AddA [Acidocella sp. 20-57-95]OYV58618.1 MAG: double-strand break repair helicase AddA [Acidocella sp. 21-58-7]HQT64395.1 double-strand break repair helicase AddA [Acidocella sp.]HQU05104.1 double-strand break repair helicase AddA [Acidocella sp.]